MRCHTLAAAGATDCGPEPRRRPAVAGGPVDLVTNGRTDENGVMPAFVASLTAQQIQDVAAYVSSVADK